MSDTKKTTKTTGIRADWDTETMAKAHEIKMYWSQKTETALGRLSNSLLTKTAISELHHRIFVDQEEVIPSELE